MTDQPTARFEMPDLIQRDQANHLCVRIWLNGVIYTDNLTTGTVTVHDDDGTIVAGPTAATMESTPVGYVPCHTFAAGDFAAQDYAEGWQIEWDITLSTGANFIFRNEAALVRRRLYPVITDQDLFRRVSALNPHKANPITTLANYQSYITEAWVTIQLRLWSAGNRPNLILSPSALRDVHLFLTLSLIFRDLSTRLNEAYMDQADRYAEQYDAAWNGLRFKYDSGTEDGTSDTDRRKNVQSVVWLCGRR